jgi:SSS family transporter
MSLLDLAVMLLYAGTLVAMGWRVGRRRQSGDELTLAGRKLPAWAVLCSMSATELSAATFIGVPHAAYTGDWFYLQLAVGSLLAKALLAHWVIPLYHELGLVTVYGYLDDRFGPAVTRVAALCFVVGRVLASGVRLFIAALALAAVTGLSVPAAIGLAGALAGAYTIAGGIRAVVYTDVVQGAVLLLAAAATLAALLSAAGGPGPLLDWAAGGERARILHLDPWLSLRDGRAFGSAVIGALFLTLATHATDHDMVQRLLATHDGRSGGRALLGSAVLNFPLTLLFLMIGTGLAHFYATAPGYEIGDSARIFPLFALHELPTGVRGLVFAGIFAAAMSSLDSAILAIATSWVVDVRPAAPGTPPDPKRIRLASLAFTFLLVGAALAMARYHLQLQSASATNDAPSLVEFALSAMTILYGGLLGVFAVGLLAPGRGSVRSALAGLGTGATIGAALFLQPLLLGETMVAWTWWIPISATATFLIAAAERRTARSRYSSGSSGG